MLDDGSQFPLTPSHSHSHFVALHPSLSSLFSALKFAQIIFLCNRFACLGLYCCPTNKTQVFLSIIVVVGAYCSLGHTHRPELRSIMTHGICIKILMPAAAAAAIACEYYSLYCNCFCSLSMTIAAQSIDNPKIGCL